MLLSKVFVGLGSLFALVGAQNDDDMELGSVLKRHTKLSTYYKLIQKYPEILLQLPSYEGVTIVAPSNDAFEQIPYSPLADIWDPEDRKTTVALLRYHMLRGTINVEEMEAGPAFVKPTLLTDHKFTNVTNGQNILVTKQPDVVVFTTKLGSRASVINYDIKFQGGLIQIVDAVLVPPSRLREASEGSKLKSFLGGLYSSELMPNLENEKDITVFAPRNQAMEAIGGTLKNMDARELARVMGYHVVPGRVLVSSKLKNATSYKTLNGKEIHVRQVNNYKYINSAKIIETDILLANGILHIISNVNNPQDTDAQPDPTRWAQTPVFSASIADEPFKTDIPCTVSCPVTQAAVEATPTPVYTPTFTRHSTRLSKGAAAPARATANVAGAALGILGAGMALL